MERLEAVTSSNIVILFGQGKLMLLFLRGKSQGIAP